MGSLIGVAASASGATTITVRGVFGSLLWCGPTGRGGRGGAPLVGADLIGAILTRAYLIGVDLTDAL